MYLRETNGDVGDASLVKRIFYSDDVQRKEGMLAQTLQKIDITGEFFALAPATSPLIICCFQEKC
jgi:hypothetical protein